MESNLERENLEEVDIVMGIESLKRQSILSKTSKPSIELVLDDLNDLSKDVPSSGKRRRSTDVNTENRIKSRGCSQSKRTKVLDDQAPRFMNTYHLESKRPFNVERVVGVLKEVLTRELKEAVYEPGNALKTCVSLTSEIRARVKSFNFDRYKIVCLVSIVENKMQSVLSMAKFLWDTERDKYATFSLSNSQLASMACVFGIYYE